MRSVNASVSAGTSAQLSAAEQSQHGTQETVTPTGADRYYNFLRLLRQGGEAVCTLVGPGKPVDRCDPSRCDGRSRTRWLGEVDAEWRAQEVLERSAASASGNFVRIAHAQLFLPPFAQALPRAQTASAAFGKLPAARTAFTSPTQSAEVRGGLPAYGRLVGNNPRLPFVAAAYGQPGSVDTGVTFFVPVSYQRLTTEPALLSGSVTIVGKIIYFAPDGGACIDYPTIDEFGQSPLKQSRRFLNALGVCSNTPPATTRPKGNAAHERGPWVQLTSADAQCGQSLRHVQAPRCGRASSGDLPVIVPPRPPFLGRRREEARWDQAYTETAHLGRDCFRGAGGLRADDSYDDVAITANQDPEPPDAPQRRAAERALQRQLADSARLQASPAFGEKRAPRRIGGQPLPRSATDAATTSVASSDLTLNGRPRVSDRPPAASAADPSTIAFVLRPADASRVHWRPSAIPSPAVASNR